MLPLPRRLWRLESFEKLALKFLKFRRIILLGFILLTLVSLMAAKSLSVDSNYMAFLPDAFPGVQNLKKVIEKTGGFGNFMIVIEGGGIEDRRRYAQTLAEKAKRFDWLDYADYKKNREKIEKAKLLFLSDQDLSEIEARLRHYIDFKKNPMAISFMDDDAHASDVLDFSDIEDKYQQLSFGSDYFEDMQSKYTVVIAWPKGSMTDLFFARRAFSDLETLLAEVNPRSFHQEMRASIGGEYRSKIAEYDSLIQNVLKSMLITFSLIGALLYFHFRRIGAIFYTFIPLLLGTAWTAGLAYFLVGRLNLLAVFLVTILFGLGIDYGIYLFSSYVSLRVEGISQVKAIARIWFGVGRSILAAAWTTALAFLVLVFTDFKGFQEFGLLAFCGVVMILFSYLIISPLLWSYAEKWGFLHPERQKHKSLMPRMNYGKSYVFAGVAVILVALAFLPKIAFEYDYANLRSRDVDYQGINSKIHQVFPLSKTPAVVITPTIEEAKLLVASLREKLPTFKTVDTVKSIVDFLPEETKIKREQLKKIEGLILSNDKYMTEEGREKMKAYLPYLNPPHITLDDLPKSVIRQFMGLPGTKGFLVFIYDKVRLSDATNAILYANEIQEIEAGGKKYYPAEGSLLFAETLVLMKKESLYAFIFMIGVVLLNLWGEYRSIKLSLLIYSPILLGLFLTLALMPLFHLKINMFNMVIFPILIGMGDDTCIHLYAGLRGIVRPQDLPQVAHRISSPILMALLTTLIGFGSMLSANHQGLQSLGYVACLGISCIVFSSLVFFPAVYKLILKNKNS